MFDCKIHVLNGFSDYEFIDYTSANFKDVEITRKTSTAACWTIYNENGKPDYMIDFRKLVKKDPYSINTISHESTHATLEIMKLINIPYEYNVTDEVVCCLNGLIMQKIYEGLFK